MSHSRHPFISLLHYIVEFLTKFEHTHHHNLPSCHSLLNPLHSGFQPLPPGWNMLSSITKNLLIARSESQFLGLISLVLRAEFATVDYCFHVLHRVHQALWFFFPPYRVLLILSWILYAPFLLNAGLPQGLKPVFTSLSTDLPLITSPRP